MVDLWIATVNVPGYLPQSDELHVFREPQAGWEHLADERERDLGEYTGQDDAYDILCDYVNEEMSPVSSGTVMGFEHPSREHDLGLAYSLQPWAHLSYPHEAGQLIECTLCLYTCHCDGDSSHEPCVHCALHESRESACDDPECVKH